MATRRQHIIPRYYLRGFTESRDSDFLWRYENTGNVDPRRLPVGSVGVERDFYAYTRADGSRDIDSVETQLANLLEQPGNRIIEQLRDGNYSLSNEDKNILANYMSMTLMRVTRNRQRIDFLMPEVGDEQLEGLPQRLGKYREIFGPRFDELEPRIIEMIEGWEDSTPDFLYNPMIYYSRIGVVIAAMHWQFILPADNLIFLSSDNPMIFDEENGFQPPDGNFLFPISQDLALIGTWEQNERSIPFQLNAEVTQEKNRWIVSEAVRYIYSCCRADWIAELIENTSQSEEN